MRPKIYTHWDDVPVIIDIPLAAQLLGKSPEWIRQQCVAGGLPAFKLGAEWRIDKAALLQHIGR